MEKIEEQEKLIKQLNEEVILLRNELSESWWSHNGWKFKDRDKFEYFSFAKKAFLKMPVSSRKDSPSAEILTEYFLGYRKVKNGTDSDA